MPDNKIKQGMKMLFEGRDEKEIDKESESSTTKPKEEPMNEEKQKADRNLRWYQRFGLELDPFDHRNLSPRVLGHDNEKRQLIEWVKEGRSILLYGATGVGKTNLINEVMQEIKENKIEGLENFGIMFHSCDTAEKLEHIRRYKKAKGFFGLGRKKVAAFMDEVHFGEDKDLIGVSAMWDKKDIHSAVFVQIHPKPKLDQLMRRIGIYKVKLNSIPKSTITNIINQRTGDKTIFDPDALEAVIKMGGENPSIVLQLCGEIASYIADPKKSITLKDVKEFRFSDIEGMSKEALRNIKLPDTLDEKARKKAGCSPYEWDVVKNLRTGDMTLKELAKDLEKKPNSVGTILNRMMKEEKVRITNTGRPKRYGLVDKFEREYILIDG